MKKNNLKLIAAALITAMIIPMGTASASANPKKGNNPNEAKILQQYTNSDENADEEDNDNIQQAGKLDWKIVKEKAKAETKIEREKAKAEWKIKKEQAKAEIKKAREEVKKGLQEQQTIIKQNNDKTQELREDIIDQKKEVTEIIEYLKKNNVVISEDILKQIQESLEVIKADVQALNSSKGVISNIYVDIKSQLEKKDADAVQTGIENVLSIQDQRYLSLQKLHDDLQILLNLLEHVKNTPLTQTPAPDTATTPATETSTDGQATVPAASRETSIQAGTSTDSNTQSESNTNEDSTTSPSQTSETQNPESGN